jgi:dTDP-4-amino-4,6-dideoxygalactose transaminase
MIHFNSSVSSPQLMAYLQELNSDYLNYRTKLYSEKSLGILKQVFPTSKLFLCSSATDALEMVAFMMDLKEGDEVIMPSFTFVSTANAFVSKGATPEEAIRFGVCCGSAATMNEGTQLFDKEVVYMLYNKS